MDSVTFKWAKEHNNWTIFVKNLGLYQLRMYRVFGKDLAYFIVTVAVLVPNVGWILIVGQNSIIYFFCYFFAGNYRWGIIFGWSSGLNFT